MVARKGSVDSNPGKTVLEWDAYRQQRFSGNMNELGTEGSKMPMLAVHNDETKVDGQGHEKNGEQQNVKANMKEEEKQTIQFGAASKADG